MPAKQTDKIPALAARLQAGDGRVFNDLYEATRPAAYFTALKIARNEQDAEDILQEAYIQLLDKIKSLENPQTFPSWFNQIVANKAKDYLKKKNPQFLEDAGAERAYTEETEDDDRDFIPEDSMDKIELQLEMMRIIDSLSDVQRTCVLLYYYDEMPVKEIAASLDVSEAAVKSRLFHARREIKTKVEALAKQNKALFGAAPMPLVIWALKSAGAAAAASSAASGAAAATLAAVTASAGGTSAAAGTAAAAGGAAAKAIAGKILAGVLAAAIVGGGTIAGTKLAQKRRAAPASETTATQPAATTSHAVTEPRTEAAAAPQEAVTLPPDRQVDTIFETEELPLGVVVRRENYAVKTANGVELRQGETHYDYSGYRGDPAALEALAQSSRTSYAAELAAAAAQINAARAAQGLKPLTENETLTAQANRRAAEIAYSGKNSPIRPDGSDYTTAFDQSGLTAGSRYEARAYSAASASAAAARLLRDEALLQPEVTQLGVGLAQTPEGDYIAVAHLYDASGSGGQAVTAPDRLRIGLIDALDAALNARYEAADRLLELNDQINETPGLRELNYDFHDDALAMRISQLRQRIKDAAKDAAERWEDRR